MNGIVRRANGFNCSVFGSFQVQTLNHLFLAHVAGTVIHAACARHCHSQLSGHRPCHAASQEHIAMHPDPSDCSPHHHLALAFCFSSAGWMMMIYHRKPLIKKMSGTNHPPLICRSFGQHSSSSSDHSRALIMMISESHHHQRAKPAARNKQQAGLLHSPTGKPGKALAGKH